MNFDLRKLGIILLVSMFIMPVWSIPLSDTNTTCNGKTNLKNFHLSKEPLKIQTPLNSNQMHNTESKFQYKEYSKTSIKKDGLKNDGLKNDGLKNDGLTILLIPIQMLENGTSSNSTNITYNESLNSSSLDAIQKHYNQTLNEYNSCCNSLNYLNEMNGYLNTNQTNLVSLMNYLLNKKIALCSMKLIKMITMIYAQN
ncbi:MAG: hypothetical protein NKF70_13130 [Methanobacterium sp. ERen5]|nr:MAG: hypothetical protein NKF70_13130 [Methanobacterium sp. ERen5]